MPPVTVMPWQAALLGVIAGLACGAVAHRATLCSFGAIEDAVVAGDTRRLKSFALALAIAMAITQVLAGTGLLPTTTIALLPPFLPWAGALAGGLMFGLGMALAGTCGFGALVRLGTGDLRALVVLAIYGAVAWSAATGRLSAIRLSLLDPLAGALAGGGGTDLRALLIPASLSAWVAPLLILALCAWVLSDRRLRRAPRLLVAGGVLGLSVAAGWYVTGVLADPFEAVPRPQGLSFVTPIARLLQALVSQPAPVPEFGMGTAVGVALGAALAAWRAGALRWEAFDDAHEMRRHLLGACLMGMGGVFAGGCTIGQGLSAGSVLAPSWPFAVGGIFAGARLGIAILLEGGPGEAWRAAWREWWPR